MMIVVKVSMSELECMIFMVMGNFIPFCGKSKISVSLV